MSILTIEFLGFGAMMLAAYYILPLKIRSWALLGFSAAFVIMSGWQGGVYLLAVAALCYGGAWGLQGLRRAEEKRKGLIHLRRLLLFVLLLADLGAMLFIKFYPDLRAWLNGASPKAIREFCVNWLLPLDAGFFALHRALLFLPTGLDAMGAAAAGLLPEMGEWLGSLKFSQPSLPALDLIVPLGLSYFTFQSAGYLIDVYRGKAEAAKNPLRTVLFVGYFLQLPQGPISTWKELEGPLNRGNRLDPVKFVSGAQLMAWGYFKKLVVADRLAITTDAVLKAGQKMPGWLAMGGTILFMIRLYADFSGGMDVVRGLSRMAGVELPENFRRPFFATSVAEYWRRWHITLGAWFRSYLLYPITTSRFGVGLGKISGKILGKKVGRMVPTALATLLVFVLIGLWHDVSWNALIYGGYFGVIMGLSLLLEPFWKWIGKKLHLPKKGWLTPFRILRTWALVLLPQFFAYPPTLEKSWRIFTRAFTFSEWTFNTFASRCVAIMSVLEWEILGGAVLLMLIVDIVAEHCGDLSGALARKPILLRWPLLILLILLVLVFGCYGAGYEAGAFLYTQF